MTSHLTFRAEAERLLNHLEIIFERVPGCDVEPGDGSLSLTFGQSGLYLFTCHGPTQQVWLASPRSGAHHFAYDEAVSLWKNVRNNEELFAFLSQEMSFMCVSVLKGFDG